MRWALRQPIVICVIIANLVFVSLIVLRESGALVALELSVYDQFLRWRPRLPADPRIVLIKVTEEDLQRQGFPITDGKIAQALRRLTDGGAAAIGVDLYRDMPVAPGEAELAAILKGNADIIWITKFGAANQQPIQPPRVLVNTEQAGFNDLIDDPGGIIRRGLLFLDDGSKTATSFPLRLALRYLKPLQLQPDPANPEHVRLGKTTIPPFESNDGGYVRADAAGYQFLLDFADTREKYRSFTLTQVLDGQVDPGAIKGRIVIIGTTARSSNDSFYTPFSEGLDVDQRMFGVELHGHTTNQLLRFALDGQPPIRVFGDFWEYAWLWVWSMLAALITQAVHAVWRFFIVVLLATAGLGLASYYALLQGYWLPLVPSVLGTLLTGAFTEAYFSGHERRERGNLMQLFSKHVSKEVAASLWDQREQFLEGGRPKPLQLTATVLCVDIRGFTTISEELDPVTLIAWLNEYMETMARQVSRHNGIVNKYIGDAIMAIFGVPLARKSTAEMAQDAVNAVNCVLSMERWLRKLNRASLAKGLPPIAIRAGIYTGPLVAGCLGSSDRMEYTVIGDTVNTAFRLESYDKTFAAPDAAGRACRILIGDATCDLLNGRFEVQYVGDVDLKGKEQKITVYHVIGRKRTLT